MLPVFRVRAYRRFPRAEMLLWSYLPGLAQSTLKFGAMGAFVARKGASGTLALGSPLSVTLLRVIIH